jgi:hypothetical protein
MGRIIWCSMPVVIFSFFLAYGVRLTLRFGPICGWWLGIFFTCLVFCFLLLWLIRLRLVIKNQTNEKTDDYKIL